MIQDDMIFKPYPIMGGFQCIMNIGLGRISVRTGVDTLFVDENHPYEVWYPDQTAPTGRQTADDIWNYIKQHSNAN